MKKTIIMFLFVMVISSSIADPIEGFWGEVLDESYFSVKTTWAQENYSRFYDFSTDSVDLIDTDKDTINGELSGWALRTKVAVRIYWGLDFVAILPYKSLSMEEPEVRSSSGIGDLDLFLKYRPVTSESPIVLMAGVTIPTGDIQAEPSLGDDYYNLHLGILNKKEFRGFELSTNILISLVGVNKDKSVYGNYARYIGTGEAPVLMNGRRIGSITGEINAMLGEKINKEHMLNGTLALEYRPFEQVIVQGGINFPILDSKSFPKRKFTPIFTVEMRI